MTTIPATGQGQETGVTAHADGAEATGPATDDEQEAQYYLDLARNSESESTRYLDANYRHQWEKNLRNWQSRHPVGSKYSADPTRSNIFRPKTRATVRKNEAMVAAAFFSNVDVLNIAPEDDNDPAQRASAAINKELVQYRLTKTIPWFLTCIGAYQDASVMGACVSRQAWRYTTRKTAAKKIEPELDPATGLQRTDAEGIPLFTEREDVKQEIIEDRPEIALIPLENFRFHPAADWRDVVNTSPFLIIKWPMYVIDVKAKMRSGEWTQLDDGFLRQAKTDHIDSTRQTREQNRQDPKDAAGEVFDYDVVWVHENIMRIADEDYQYFTLGTQALLNWPRPAREVYLHTPRPFVLGIGVIETHKTMPSSKVEITQDLQREVNEIANQRVDNVKLAMNGRPIVRAGGDVDLAALKRHAPGMPIVVKNPMEDIKWDRPPDVTASSYAEQDRLNLDFDEVAGAFSPSSVASNRKLNETVGGMHLLAGSANAVGEYDLRVFTETWVEPVLRQIVKLEQKYETDAVVLALAGTKAQLLQRYGINTITDDLLDRELTLNVNVGIGATDPMQRIAKFQMAAKITGDIFGPEIRQVLNKEDLIAEIWGAAGYRDGKRFFNFENTPDPKVAQMQNILQKLAQENQSLQMQLKDKKNEHLVKWLIAKLQAEVSTINKLMEKDGALQAQTIAQRHDLVLEFISMLRDAVSGAGSAMSEPQPMPQLAPPQAA